MMKIQRGAPLPYCVELPRASDEQRREQVVWCQENFPGSARNYRWIPPFRDKKRDPELERWYIKPALDAWKFLYEQDAAMFHLVWGNSL